MHGIKLSGARANVDLYRYFHPHHNPRLRSVPLRLQELGELEQAAKELKKAVKRAEIRSANAPAGPFRQEHFGEVIAALDFLVDSLSTLTNAHPGDSSKTMQDLLREREEAPGWENWSRLLRQRLELLRQYDEPDDLEQLRCPQMRHSIDQLPSGDSPSEKAPLLK